MSENTRDQARLRYEQALRTYEHCTQAAGNLGALTLSSDHSGFTVASREARRSRIGLAVAAHSLGETLGATHGISAFELARELDAVPDPRVVRDLTRKIAAALDFVWSKQPRAQPLRVQRRRAELAELVRNDPDAAQPQLLDRLHDRGFKLELRTLQSDLAALRKRE